VNVRVLAPASPRALDNGASPVILTTIESIFVYARCLMMKLFKRAKEAAVEFCDRCSQVCTAGCRREALVEGARSRALAAGGRFL
jgi:hypothetical protein